MADVDCLATLGDAWPNLGQVRSEVDFLGLPDSWEARLEALCRAELEQAHGRLRVVHRKKPARALHVGRVLPGGTGWSGGRVDFRRSKTGPAKALGAMATEEMAEVVRILGGVRAAARLLRCAPATVTRYLNGARAIPPEIAGILRDAIASSGELADA
jgi:hypothetical protein